MAKLEALLFSFLSRDWAGLALAAIPAAAGLLALTPSSSGPDWARWLGWGALAAALLLASGAARHLLRMAAVRRRHPPPGKLVDIGGYRVHLLAEGDARGQPPVVWLPGGHASGFNLHNLHRMLRGEARSILVDRPGAGWSDIGPFPRTTAGEAAEIIRALERSGEPAPFVLVGHSFGGLLVANVARRRPDLVCALVLMDPTPPDTIIYGPRHGILKMSIAATLRTVLPRLFGSHRSATPPLDAFDRGRVATMEQQLGDAALTAERAIESATRAHLAFASIRRELQPEGMAAVGWDTVVYDGDLGDLPLFLVAPRELSDGEFAQVWAIFAERAGTGADALVWKARARRLYERTRERFLAASTNAERIYTPAGTTHFFAWESPEAVIEVVRRALATARREATP